MRDDPTIGPPGGMIRDDDPTDKGLSPVSGSRRATGQPAPLARGGRGSGRPGELDLGEELPAPEGRPDGPPPKPEPDPVLDAMLIDGLKEAEGRGPSLWLSELELLVARAALRTGRDAMAVRARIGELCVAEKIRRPPGVGLGDVLMGQG